MENSNLNKGIFIFIQCLLTQQVKKIVNRKLLISTSTTG